MLMYCNTFFITHIGVIIIDFSGTGFWLNRRNMGGGYPVNLKKKVKLKIKVVMIALRTFKN